MAYVLQGGKVFCGGICSAMNLRVEHGQVTAFGPIVSISPEDRVFYLNGAYIFPGFADVHTHLREPGFSYKETVSSGTRAAARGGFTRLCAMPNLNPVPDSLEHLQVQLELIRSDAVVHVVPFGALTVGEKGQTVADLESMAPFVAGFSDDGKGVQSPARMEEAMSRAAALGKIVSAHCEDESLLRGGYIHDGTYAAVHGHRGICSESEWGPVKRDLALARKTGVKYHVCHVSCKETVDLIRRAKAEGIDVTCETAPHYLLLTEADLQEDGRFKMNPPLRTEADRLALLEGLADGTVDMIATDHAPHSAEEKGRGLEHSLMGISGLETAFPVLYTGLVRTGELSVEQLVHGMAVAPRRRFGFEPVLEIGAPAEFCVFDLNASFRVDPARFLSQGKSTPFAGQEVFGVCRLTFCGGKPVWTDGTLEQGRRM